MKEDFVITHDNLPLAVSMLLGKVSRLELLVEQSSTSSTEVDKWFNPKELCAYLPDKPALQTVYGWSSAGTIPSHSKGKKLFFLKSEIDLWLKAGRRKTNAEITAGATNFLKTNKKRG